MSSLIRYPNRRLFARDPFSFARELFGDDAWLAPAKSLGEFAPSFDVKETDEAYVIIADLPGVKDENVEISLTGNHLTISGSRESEKKDEGDNYHVTERSYGSFRRELAFPAEIDPSAVTAEHTHGVLTVRLPKSGAERPRRIEIKVD